MGKTMGLFTSTGKKIFEFAAAIGLSQEVSKMVTEGIKGKGDVLKVALFGLGHADESSFLSTLADFEQEVTGNGGDGAAARAEVIRYLNTIHHRQNNLYRRYVSSLPTREEQMGAVRDLYDAPDDATRNEMLLNVMRSRDFVKTLADWVVETWVENKVSRTERFLLAWGTLSEAQRTTIRSWLGTKGEKLRDTFRKNIAALSPDVAKQTLECLANLPDNRTRMTEANLSGLFDEGFDLNEFLTWLKGAGGPVRESVQRHGMNIDHAAARKENETLNFQRSVRRIFGRRVGGWLLGTR